MLTRMPDIITKKAPARRMGQYDGGGLWIDVGSSTGPAAPFPGGVPLPSPYFCAQKSSRSWTTGTVAKLYTGGGDGMVHSSVRPSHGSAGAAAPERVVVITLQMKTRNESTMTNAPMVATMFQ